MSITSLLLFVVIGAVAGWLAGKIMKVVGFGLVGNIIVGIIGSFIGGFMFKGLGITAGNVRILDRRACRRVGVAVYRKTD